MPNGLITEDCLRVHPEGFALALTLPWYRSLWLSSVSTIRVTVDGVDVPEADLRLRAEWHALRDRRPGRSRATCCGSCRSTRSWSCAATSRSPSARRTTSSSHGELRLPYMQIAPGQDGAPGMYVPNIVHQELALTVTDAARIRARARDGGAAPRRRPPTPTLSSSGLTLYSASAEFRAGWYDFDGLLDRVAELGIGPGIEIVASQMLPTLPGGHRTSSCAPGARRSTATDSTPARSARTSTWAGAATAT